MDDWFWDNDGKVWIKKCLCCIFFSGVYEGICVFIIVFEVGMLGVEIV